MFRRVTRNRKGIKLAALRGDVDDVIDDLHDTLSEAYYDHWRHGESRPWLGFDVLPTPELSKTQYGALHGALPHLHLIALYQLNQVSPKARDADIIERQRDGAPRPINKLQEARTWLAENFVGRSTKLVPIRQAIVRGIQRKTGHKINVQ